MKTSFYLIQQFQYLFYLTHFKSKIHYNISVTHAFVKTFYIVKIDKLLLFVNYEKR